MDYLQYLLSNPHPYHLHSCVLNLIINGLPSILQVGTVTDVIKQVLNLIINGLPSILIKGYCI